MIARPTLAIGSLFLLAATTACGDDGVSNEGAGRDSSSGGDSASGGTASGGSGDNASGGASSGGASSGGTSAGGSGMGGGAGAGGSPEPAVSVTASGSQTTEGGGTVTLEIVLDAPPSDSVSVSLTSSDESEGLLAPDELTFTGGNWDEPQVVTVTGQSDAENDVAVDYSVGFQVVSDDERYSGYGLDPVPLTNVSFVPCSSFAGTDFDDETAGEWSGDADFATTFPDGADGSPHALQLKGGKNQHFVGAQRDFDAMTPVYLSIWVKKVELAEGDDDGSTFVVLGDDQVETNSGIIWFYSDENQWRFSDGSDSYLLGAPVLDQWEHLELFIDWDTKTSDVYFNGTLEVDDLPFRASESENVQRMNLYNYYDSTGAWDEIEFGCLE